MHTYLMRYPIRSSAYVCVRWRAQSQERAGRRSREKDELGHVHAFVTVLGERRGVGFDHEYRTISNMRVYFLYDVHVCVRSTCIHVRCVSVPGVEHAYTCTSTRSCSATTQPGLRKSS